MLKTILIDFDDTLWDTYTNHKQSLNEVYDARGWHTYYPTFDDFFDHYRPINEALWSDYRHNLIDKETLSHLRFSRMFEGRCKIEKDEIASINADFLERCSLKTKMCEGALELVQYLTRYFEHVCIVSNGLKEVQYRKLHGCAIGRYITQMVLSEEVQSHKPEKKIFDIALQKTGSRRTEAVMIGDSWDADIRGASNAGIASIWYNPNRLPLPTETGVVKPVVEVHSLTELIPLSYLLV